MLKSKWDYGIKRKPKQMVIFQSRGKENREGNVSRESINDCRIVDLSVCEGQSTGG